MPHSSDPKLIVPCAADGDPLRQTADHRGKKEKILNIYIHILGNYTQEWSSHLRAWNLSGRGLCEFNGGAG